MAGRAWQVAGLGSGSSGLSIRISTVMYFYGRMQIALILNRMQTS